MRPNMTELPELLAFTPSETIMWQVDADPSLQFRIVGVIGLQSRPDPEVLVERVERMTRTVPRLRHRVVPNPLPGLRPHWELDPHFDLDYHLRTVHLPEGSGDSDLLQLASLTRQDDFPLGRSPWRMLLVTGLPDGRAALIVCLHHVITDGIGAVGMAALLFDLDQAGRTELGPLPAVPSGRPRSWSDRLVTGFTQEADLFGALLGSARGAAGGLRHPRRAGQHLVEAANAAVRFADPTTAPGSPLPRTTAPGSRFLTVQIPLDRLKAAGRTGGGKLNDAYLAILIGGLARYHDKHGLPLKTLTLSMPVNTRPPDSEGHGGNDTLLKVCALPADIADPAARIAAIATIARQEQTVGSHLFSQALGQALARIPGPLLRTALAGLAEGLDFSTTNVPGVPVPLYLAGARVGSMQAFVSRARSPLMAALLSYNGTAHVGLTIDPVAIPDGELLVSCIQAEIDDVLSLADGG